MDRVIAAEVFVCIAEHGSMTAAAHVMDMSRAMVTRYLTQMETWAGVRLLHRTTRRLTLTEAGTATLARCREMLAIASGMNVLEESGHDPTGLLRISCAQSLAQYGLAAMVSRYLQQYPFTAVEFHISNHTVNLVEERIDLAIRITNNLAPGLIARPLGTCSSVVCAAPAYIARHGKPQGVEDLALHNCLTYSYFGKSLWTFTRQTQEYTVPVSGNLSANDSTVLLAAAVAGAGVTLQPVHAVFPLIRSGELQVLLPDYQPRSLGVYGVYQSRQHMPLTLRSMLDFMVENWSASMPNNI
ncbi:LysR family transcriptional regulator [Methylobacillus gramineus]|uniref:LysR family transcriptional regulator n=1 Tax=Methylobacillus gramineus TaxID=755169 RepID=UPI001CFF9505|nr:LysR family transcriptional regulator [Methylobacillus gramineus]MCB5184055.1 LysR family transcriptional regulator [Methylobacillus gramineus]